MPPARCSAAATNEINWAAHDPTTLADNLRGTKLLMYMGNGTPGPLIRRRVGTPEPSAMRPASTR